MKFDKQFVLWTSRVRLLRSARGGELSIREVPMVTATKARPAFDPQSDSQVSQPQRPGPDGVTRVRHARGRTGYRAAACYRAPGDRDVCRPHMAPAACLGAIPALAVFWLRRHIRETPRFELAQMARQAVEESARQQASRPAYGASWLTASFSGGPSAPPWRGCCSISFTTGTRFPVLSL